MATDGPTPPPCSKKMLREGVLVFITHTIPSNSMEAWVKSVAADSGQDVDWHFVGGRACVKTLGDVGLVQASIRKLMPHHDERFSRASKAIMGEDHEPQPPRPDWW